MMLRGTEPREALHAVIEKEVPAIMSHLSRGKWHAVKVLLRALGIDRFDVEVSPRKKLHPIDIQIDQQVGISFKYEYGKFIFETTVIDLKPSLNTNGSGTIVLAVPDLVEIIQRRSYFRVEVPRMMEVNVMLWHRCYADNSDRMPPEHYWQGKLVDISAGGAQVAVDAAQRPDFKEGQFVMLTFTPMPYEAPLTFSAQIRNVLPTADNNNICFGLQMVGLEASPEGRQTLRQLCNVAEQYHQMNQSSIRQQDLHTTSL